MLLISGICKVNGDNKIPNYRIDVTTDYHPIVRVSWLRIFWIVFRIAVLVIDDETLLVLPRKV